MAREQKRSTSRRIKNKFGSDKSGAGKSSFGKPSFGKPMSGKFGKKRSDSDFRRKKTSDASKRKKPIVQADIPADVKSADGKIRLNKFLADSGLASRRKADEIIEDGQITINGKKVYELGIRIDPKIDVVLFNGKPVKAQSRFVYYLLNKPRSVVTTTSDPFGRPTVLDYFPKETLRVFPVGRLDWDAEGLILITNDGEFAHKVIHPEKGVLKTYQVKLDGLPTDHQLEKLRVGVSIEGGGRVSAVFVRRLSAKTTDKKAWIEITIREGKNHQIKKMFHKIGFDVIKLRRVAIGGLKLGSLQAGAYKELTPDDFLRIFKRPKPATTAEDDVE
jgi:23S rRNA pseudouridine2605 synthase